MNNLSLLKDTNHLSNSSLPDTKLSYIEKEVILDDFSASANTKVKKSVNLKSICKVINDNRKSNLLELDLSGYRIDKENKPLFTKLETTMEIAKWLISNNLVSKIDLKDRDSLVQINEIFEQLARTSDVLKRLDFIREYVSKKFGKELDIEIIKSLVKNVKGVMQTHSLSYDAMLEYIEVGIKFINEKNEEQAINSQQFFSDIILNNRGNNSKFKNEDGSCKKYIPKSIFDDAIISPTSKRAFIQTINVVNKILKLYSKEYEINNIVVELAREKNDSEKRKMINKIQTENEKEIDKIFSENNIDRSYLNNLNYKTRLKLKLLKEQDYYDIYDGQKIDPIDVILNQGKYHEEHIIPFSICFIDSRRNKVVSKFENNKEKGDLTPYEWLSSKGKYEEFKNRVLRLYDEKRISKNKKEFLLFEKDPRTDLLGFIEKNLSDTRYACKLVLDVFQSFFKTNKELYPEAKIKVINGAMTNYARNNLFFSFAENEIVKLGIQKRREFYEHHAVDATILAFLGSNAKVTKLLNLKKYKNKGEKEIIDEITGEVVKMNVFDDNKEILEETKKLSRQIFSTKCKFSRPIYRKKNVGLSKDTVYSMRWKDKEKTKGDMITKIDLLDKDDSLSAYFNEKDPKFVGDKLLCYQEDKTLYNHLKSIFDNQKYHADGTNKELHINPFINYMRMNFLLSDEKETGTKTKFKHVIIDLNGSRKFVRQLRYIAKEKAIDNIILMDYKENDKLSKLSSKSIKNIGFKESLNALSVRIYKDNKGKYILIPINQKVLSFENNKMVVDENKLILLLRKFSILNKDFISITYGKAIINENNQLFYFIGGGNFKQNKLEIKPTFCDLNAFYNSRMLLSVSTIIKDYKFCEVDELGNIYNIREISIN